MKISTTGIAEVYVDDEGFVVVKILDKSDIEKKDVEKTGTLINKLTNGEKHYAIKDVRDINLGHVSMKAFQYHASNPQNNKYAEAIVLNSVGIRLLANFYIKTFRPKVPTKVFTNFEQAKSWLREMKKMHIFKQLN